MGTTPLRSSYDNPMAIDTDSHPRYVLGEKKKKVKASHGVSTQSTVMLGEPEK